METTILGRTGLKISRLGMGLAEIGRLTMQEVADVEHLVNSALDSGINFLDTAACYGISEELIGRTVSHRRNDYSLATKCGHITGSYTGEAWTAKTIEDSIDRSLERMNTDYLDLVQLHNPIKNVVEENDVIQTLLDIKQDGKVRFIGTSSFLPFLPDHVAMGVFDTFQIPYSALNREHEKLITSASKSGAGTIIRGGVSKGEFGRNREWENYSKSNLDDLLSDGESRTAFLLRFVLSHPHLNTTIVGTKNLEHFKENINTANKGKLSEDIYEEAKKRLSTIGAVPHQ